MRKTGHWYRDRPECLDSVRNSHISRRQVNDTRVPQENSSKEEQKKKIGTFFRQGGQ